MRGERPRSLSPFDQPRRAIAVRRPQAAPFPAGARIVDAAVEPFRVEPERIRHAKDDHLAVRPRDQAVVQVPRRHRYVVAEAKRVVLIDPRVVARLGAVLADSLEPRTGILLERPAFRTMVAGRLRAVQRALALAAVEAFQMPARERQPHHAVA